MARLTDEERAEGVRLYRQAKGDDWQYGLFFDWLGDCFYILIDTADDVARLEAERDALLARLAAAEADVTSRVPDQCGSCESQDIFYDPADGWCCRSCGRTDADE